MTGNLSDGKRPGWIAEERRREINRVLRFHERVDSTLAAAGLTRADANDLSDEELLTIPGFGVKSLRFVRHRYPYDPYGWLREEMERLASLCDRVMLQTGLRIYGDDGNEPPDPQADVAVFSTDLIDLLSYVRVNVVDHYRPDLDTMTADPY